MICLIITRKSRPSLGVFPWHKIQDTRCGRINRQEVVHDACNCNPEHHCTSNWIPTIPVMYWNFWISDLTVVPIIRRNTATLYFNERVSLWWTQCWIRSLRILSWGIHQKFISSWRMFWNNVSSFDIWSAEWCNSTSKLRFFIPDSGLTHLALPRPVWMKWNHLRTGIKCFRSSMHKWGIAPSAICKCGVED